MVAGRRLAGKAFDDQVGPQPPQYLDEQVDVLADLPETEPAGVGIVLGGHRRAAENLQLVEFHRRERQRIDRCDLLQQHFVGLARQPEDEMRPHVQPLSAAISTARRAQAKSWPRFTARNVSSQVDSMPNSTAT